MVLHITFFSLEVFLLPNSVVMILSGGEACPRATLLGGSACGHVVLVRPLLIPFPQMAVRIVMLRGHLASQLHLLMLHVGHHVAGVGGRALGNTCCVWVSCSVTAHARRWSWSLHHHRMVNDWAILMKLVVLVLL